MQDLINSYFVPSTIRFNKYQTDTLANVRKSSLNTKDV